MSEDHYDEPESPDAGDLDLPGDLSETGERRPETGERDAAALERTDGGREYTMIFRDAAGRWHLHVWGACCEGPGLRFRADCASLQEAAETLVLWTKGVIIV
jgi:hypothetical protein